MNNEEKILEILVSMQGDIKGIHVRLDGLEKRMDSMEKRMGSMEKRIDSIERTQEENILPSLELLKAAAITQENVVLPRLELLGEGQAALHRKLENLAPLSRVEALEDDVAVVKDVTRRMRREIAELKQAQ